MSTKLKFFIFGAFLLFCALPLIFKDKKNISDFLLRDDAFYEREPSLPVYPQGNLIGNYVSRVKQFYTPEKNEKKNIKNPGKPYIAYPQKAKSKKTNNAPEEKPQYNNSANTDETELLFAAETAENNFSTDTISQDGSGFVFDAADTVNLNDGTVLTKDNLLLYPNDEGYVYNGKFFKNGTYPKFANRRYIEGALNRYHSKVAERIGKRAIYRKDNKGNLKVDYVTENNAKNSNSATDNTLLASSKFRNGLNKYQGAHINGKQDTGNSTADASLQTLQDTYNLLDEKLKNGMFGDYYRPYRRLREDVQSATDAAVENASAENNDLLDNTGAPSVTITNNAPQNNDNYDFADNPENVLTILVGEDDFTDRYSWAVHDMGCNTAEIFTPKERDRYNIAQRMEDDPNITISIGTCKAVVYATPSADINQHIRQADNVDELRDRIEKYARQTNKTNIKVISTDRKTSAMVDMINEEGSIRNSHGNTVHLLPVGPTKNEYNLANTMENVTNSIVQENDKAAEINQIFNEYYLTTQLSPIKTMLAYPTQQGDVFVLNDPGNSYWIKNPDEINQYQQQYMYKDGVYYQGVVMSRQELTDLANKERTNLLIVSGDRSKPESKNGTVKVRVKEEDVNISSFYPEEILRNSILVKRMTEIGDATADNISTILHPENSNKRPNANGNSRGIINSLFDWFSGGEGKK